jgi:hypothetical protein
VLVLSLGVALGRVASKLFYQYEEREAERKHNLSSRIARIEAAKIKREKILEAKSVIVTTMQRWQQKKPLNTALWLLKLRATQSRLRS